MMETKNVFIENFPRKPWYKETPTIIAILALIISIVSLYWGTVETIKSSRPFVWASSYTYTDTNNLLRPLPSYIGFKVINAPARILQTEIEILNKSKSMFHIKYKNEVHFPDNNSYWTVDIGTNVFNKLMSLPESDKNNLIRIVNIKYSAIDRKKIYYFHLEQSYNNEVHQWIDFKTESN